MKLITCWQDVASAYMDSWTTTALSGGINSTVLPTFGIQGSEWVLPYNIYPQTLFGFQLMNQSVRITLSHASSSPLTPRADI